MSKNFQVNFIHIIFFKKPNKKIYNRAKELYCDITIFVFWFFIVYLPKKKKIETEKWPKTADSLLLLGNNHLGCCNDRQNYKEEFTTFTL